MAAALDGQIELVCGAFSSKGSGIGQVYMGERIRFFDRRMTSDKYKAYGEGNYLCPEAIVLAKILKLPLSVICTGNSVDLSPTDEAILLQEPVVAKEMEAAAIAWVASLYSIPVVAIKAVTDLLDHPLDLDTQFRQNLAIAMDNLEQQVIAVLNILLSCYDSTGSLLQQPAY